MIHKIENLRRVHKIGRVERELTLDFPNHRMFYNRYHRNLERSMNQREANRKRGTPRTRRL